MLNPAEKRNAMIGKMRDFVADLGEKHRVFHNTEISGDRFGWDNLAAMCVALEIAEGPCDVKAPDLKRMYEQGQGFGAIPVRLAEEPRQI